jgi:hypothetical protein
VSAVAGRRGEISGRVRRVAPGETHGSVPE